MNTKSDDCKHLSFHWPSTRRKRQIIALYELGLTLHIDIKLTHLLVVSSIFREKDFLAGLVLVVYELVAITTTYLMC